MMDSKRKFQIHGLISTTLIILVGVLSVVCNIMNLWKEWYLIGLIIFLAGGCIIFIYQMYRNYIEKEFYFLDRGPRDDIRKEIKQMCDKESIKEIDIGGLALRANFFKKTSNFPGWLRKFLIERNDVKVRIWLLDPDSEARKMREMAEREKKDGLLRAACYESLETLQDIVYALWKKQKIRNPQIVLVNQNAITHFIFRVDDEMIVSPYLQHGTGNESPVFFLQKDNYWFNVYKKQFEKCFSLNYGTLFPPEKELQEQKKE